MEVRAYLSYRRKTTGMCYWRSTSGFEVDLVLDDQGAIEVKSAGTIHARHLKGLRALREEGTIRHFAVVSCDRHERTTADGITLYPWRHFIERLWRGAIV